MKVVVTAREFVTPEGDPLELLRNAGLEVVDYISLNLGNGTSDEEMARYIGDADIVITGQEPFHRSTIEKCPNVKMLSRRSIGYDTVDLDACRERGITVTRVAGTVEGAVAEHVMAYILHFARNVAGQSASMHSGEWIKTMMPGAKSRTLGLVGFGGIGKEIAKRAVPFGMKVLYYCRHPRPEWEEEYHVTYCGLDELLAESDYVSVNVALTESTRGMFGAAEFAKMKKGSVFINIARAPVMDDRALRDALLSGWLRGAGVDVFTPEPCPDSPLFECPTAVLTPHTAPFTSENFVQMNMAAARNVLDYLRGEIRPSCHLV